MYCTHVKRLDTIINKKGCCMLGTLLIPKIVDNIHLKFA